MERTTFEVAFCDLKLEVLDANVDVAICDLRDSCQLEHEIGWEPINIALDLFVEALCGYPIEARKIRVEQHPMTAKYENRSADLINGNRGRMHEPIPQQGRWLNQVVRGYFAYHAVPTNSRRLRAFRYHVLRLWHRTLRRRSQKDFTSWDRICRLALDYLPSPRILHPWPSTRFDVTHPRWKPNA